MTKMKLTLTAMLFALSATAWAENTDAVKQNIENFVGKPVVETVSKIPYGDLYEVVLKSGELIYTDEKASFVMDGRIIDGKIRRCHLSADESAFCNRFFYLTARPSR